MFPIGDDSPEENEVTLCEMVVEAAEVVPVMLANQAHKAVKRRR